MMMAESGMESVTMRFIVFSDDWGVHPSSCQHLFRRISRRHDVVWINTVGMRPPTLTWSDARKITRKLGGMLKRGTESSDSIESARVRVVQPPMLPFGSSSLSRQFNAWSATRAMRRSFDGGSPPIVLTTVPNVCDYVKALPGAKVVYYCVDDFSEWPGLDKSLILQMENSLIEKADILVATSDRLYERLSESGKPTHMLPHGVDLDHFSADEPVEHSCFTNIPAPRAGFFGLFDDRSDQDLIRAVAVAMPDISFVIAGPVETTTDRLKGLPNVYFTGSIAYERLPSFIKGLQVLFIPYKIDTLSESLSPLKLKEYLATGKPVVTTSISAAKQFDDLLNLADTPGQWADDIRRLLDCDWEKRRKVVSARFAQESWDHKADLLLEMCQPGANA